MNIFSCDVEDWYQSSYDINASIPKRVFTNVEKCINILEEYNVKGTFFIQGMVAEQRPEVVKLIDSKGHEVASHCYSHKSIFSMSSDTFNDEVELTNKLLEDITGKKVKGFRAPNFSIFNSTDFAFEVLKANGIEYDSSMFPMTTRRYGNPGVSLNIYKDEKTGLLEVPITLLNIKKINIPVAGGGYMRLLPYFLLNKAIQSVNKNKRPFVLYCHPYEFDYKELWDIDSSVSFFYKLHQGIGRKGFPGKIKKIIDNYKFTSIEEYLLLENNEIITK